MPSHISFTQYPKWLKCITFVAKMSDVHDSEHGEGIQKES